MSTTMIPAEPAASLEPPPESNSAQLLSGIAADAQRLIEQQFELTRREIEQDLRRAATVAAIVVLGGGTLFLGLTELTASVVHGLHTWSNPAVDPVSLPLWACHAWAAAALLALGGACTLAGGLMFMRMKPLQQTAAAAEETLEWAKNRK